MISGRDKALFSNLAMKNTYFVTDPGYINTWVRGWRIAEKNCLQQYTDEFYEVVDDRRREPSIHVRFARYIEKAERNYGAIWSTPQEKANWIAQLKQAIHEATLHDPNRNGSLYIDEQGREAYPKARFIFQRIRDYGQVIANA